jgi:hypothetical protein
MRKKKGLVKRDRITRPRTNIQGETTRSNPNEIQDSKSVSELSSIDKESEDSLGLHPLLVCDIEPDIRPFTWPRRKRKPVSPDNRPTQLDLFGGNNEQS